MRPRDVCDDLFSPHRRSFFSLVGTFWRQIALLAHPPNPLFRPLGASWTIFSIPNVNFPFFLFFSEDDIMSVVERAINTRPLSSSQHFGPFICLLQRTWTDVKSEPEPFCKTRTDHWARTRTRTRTDVEARARTHVLFSYFENQKRPLGQNQNLGTIHLT